MSFSEGDVIMVTSTQVDDDDGWWEGVLNGKKGVFPSIVVEETTPPVDQPVPRQRAQTCLLYTSPSPRDATLSRMPSSA